MLVGVLLGLNLLTFIVYGVDKSAALNARRRISEKVLLGLGLLGGWPGAFIAQRLWRHKTQKMAFQGWFWLTAFLNCALGWLVWQLLAQP